ncbi:MAG: hypothetical protein JXK94_01610 [Deltaproteobacteria bacterium]|nr:hypothetical protein [Deltaproteobacteria bacterium]
MGKQKLTHKIVRAFHESGHAVIGFEFGYRILEVSLKAPKANQGLVTMQYFESNDVNQFPPYNPNLNDSEETVLGFHYQKYRLIPSFKKAIIDYAGYASEHYLLQSNDFEIPFFPWRYKYSEFFKNDFNYKFLNKNERDLDARKAFDRLTKYYENVLTDPNARPFDSSHINTSEIDYRVHVAQNISSRISRNIISHPRTWYLIQRLGFALLDDKKYKFGETEVNKILNESKNQFSNLKAGGADRSLQ